MPKQDFSFETNGPKRLEISWGMFWKNITIRLDGIELGTIASQMEFRQGKEYSLPDGSKLFVRLANSLMGQEVQVTRDGKPVPGSSSHPETRIRSAYTLLYFIAGWKVLFGILGMVALGVDLSKFSMEMISIFLGVVFFFLATMARKRSILALVAGIVLFAGDAAYSTYVSMQAGNQPNVFSLVIQVFLIYYLYQGIKAMQLEKQGETNPQSGNLID